MIGTAIRKIFNQHKTRKQGVMTILYGGQSGNSEFIAKEAKKYLAKNGLEPRVVNMAKYNFQQLKEEEFLLIIVSTHGEGEPPESASRFYHALLSADAPNLRHLQFAVCALGDSSYEFFCQTGKDMDLRLEELGATRFFGRVDCDVEFNQAAAGWVSNVLNKYKSGKTSSANSFQIEQGNQRKTYEAVINNKYRLNEGSGSATFHVELSVDDPDFRYHPGDSVSIVPQNPQQLVERIIQQLDCRTETLVEFQGKKDKLGNLLKTQVEVTALSKGVLERYQSLAKNNQLEQLLTDEKSLHAYLKGHDVSDLVADFPSHLKAGELVSVLRKIQPRLYSIASSLKKHPGEVHLIIKQVCFSLGGREREGACSGYLNQWLDTGSKIAFRLVPNKQFHLPKTGAPLIMIAAGTGIAPFRAFMQEREEQNQNYNWLFFGEKNRQYDLFYHDEWAQWLGQKNLNRLDLAFSRDQEQKVYVQHKILAHGKTFFDWLEQGAHIYICGSIKMGNEVGETIQQVIEIAGNLPETDAIQYLEKLKEEDRWHVDVY
jgi:sulfite reductase (NADPH) flavoprotein alpha-component